MEATDITFNNRTNHREEGGGYEEWSFNAGSQKFSLFCDIRIPGVVSSFYEKMPEDRNKVSMTDIIFTTSSNITDIYDPSLSTEEVRSGVKDGTIKILLEKIKPLRDFKYVNFVYSKTNSAFYKDIFDQICNEGTEELKRDIFRIINPDAQLLIDAGQLEFATGPLK
jgi:hypothetical protein